MVKERPILFSGEMVRAILEGRKTQTRRIVKKAKDVVFGCELAACEIAGEINRGKFFNSKYGEPGDRLWVRETFIDGWPCHDGDHPDQFDENGNQNPKHVWCRADKESISQFGSKLEMWVDENGNFKDSIPWKPSIHMPRWASRLTLEITNVRVERLNDISEEDAKSEGCIRNVATCGLMLEPGSINYVDARGQFRSLWESINGPGSWEKNPWVWCIEFKRVCPVCFGKRVEFKDGNSAECLACNGNYKPQCES